MPRKFMKFIILVLLNAPGSRHFTRVRRIMSGVVPQNSLRGKSAAAGKRAASPHCQCSRFLRLPVSTLSRTTKRSCATQTADLTQPSDLVVGIDLGTTNSAVAVSLPVRNVWPSLLFYLRTPRCAEVRGSAACDHQAGRGCKHSTICSCIPA